MTTLGLSWGATRCKNCRQIIPLGQGLRCERGNFCNGTCYCQWVLKYKIGGG